MSPSKPGKPPLAGLTSLRFFAAAYTMLYHTRGNLVWFRAGYSGVTLFFVLSGFVLAYNHSDLRPGERFAFYVSRFARIYPLYFVAYFLMLPWYLQGLSLRHDPWFYVKGSALYLLLVQTWLPPFRQAVSAGAWTMPVEAFFYLVFPFFIVWLGRVRRRWILTVALLTASMLLPSAFFDLVWIPRHPQWEHLVHQIYSVPPFHLCEFLLGMVLGLRYLHHRPVFSGWHVLAALALCIAVLAPMGQATYRLNEILMNGGMMLPYGLLIFTVAGWDSRLLASPVLQLGGEISYSMYLLQWVLVEAIQAAIHHARGLVPLRFAVYMGGCYLSYRLIERPGRLLVLRLFHVRSHPKPIETAMALP